LGLTGIRNGLIVTPDGVVPGGVLIEDGRIAAIGDDRHHPAGSNVLDARGTYVFPGIVDPEAHLGSNAALDEDFASETRAAVAYGVTTWNLHLTTHTIFRAAEGRPGPERNLTFGPLVDEFRDIGEESSHCDFSLTPLLMTIPQAREIPDLAAKAGIPTFKLYLHMRLGRGELTQAWPQAPLLGVQAFDDALIFTAMREVAKLGEHGLLSMHCENWEIARLIEQELREARRTDNAAWNERSPGYLESMHVRTYAYLARQLGCRIHIQHVTVPETLEELRLARAEGGRIYGQTGAHYLVLDASDWKLNVPLRPRAVHQAMWDAVSDGTIDAIGTDHVCRRMPRAAMERGNVWETISGFPSRVEAHLPIMFSEGVSKGRITVERFAEVMSANPARIWGHYPQKGAIRVGSDADFVLVDPERTVTIGPEHILSRAGWSLYEGWKVKGWPVATVLRGELVAEWEGDRCNVASKSAGRYVYRSSAAQTSASESPAAMRI
jgi:dihydropyrimidinase/dihydroorotase